MYSAHKRACVKENKHDTANDKKFLSKENYKCQEQDCSFSCSLRLDILNHLKNSHSFDCCWEEKTFQT